MRMDEERVSGPVGNGFAGAFAEHGVDHHDVAVVVHRRDDAVPSVQVQPRLVDVRQTCDRN